MELKEWTVAELIEALSACNPSYTVTLQDADTMWTIPKFSLQVSEGNIHIIPCDYPEMR